MTYNDLSEVLGSAIAWEEELRDLYDVAEIGLKNKESVAVIKELKRDLIRKLSVLEKVRVEDYGKTKPIELASDQGETDMVPRKAIRKDSTPGEILARILEKEERIRAFYASVGSAVGLRVQKELFASLVKFKEAQAASVLELKQRYR